jgi:hypothetical protein
VASAVDTAVIAVIGVFFLGMGMYALAAPAMLVRPFGIALEQSTSRSGVRAVYGGYGLAMAAVLAYAAIDAGPNRTGIVLTATCDFGAPTRAQRGLARPSRERIGRMLPTGDQLLPPELKL